MEVLKSEYQVQLQKVSTFKKQLNDLELRETEEINQLEFERSLLNAEFDSETQKISKARMKIALLKHKETRISGFGFWGCKTGLLLDILFLQKLSKN